MDLLEASRSEKRKSFATAMALAVMVMLVAAPIAQARHHPVRVINTVKVKHQGAATIRPQGAAKAGVVNRFESMRIPEMGLTDAPGSLGALAVRTFGGGGGLLGAGRCAALPGPTAGTPVDIPAGNIITGIIITGTNGQVAISTTALPGGHANKVTRFRVNADNPNTFVGLGNGLSTTAILRFAGGAANDVEAPGDCEFVLIGQGEGMVTGG